MTITRSLFFHQRDGRCSGERERGAGVECSGVRDVVVQDAEERGAGEDAESLCEVVETECASTRFARDLFGDPRAFSAFGERERDRVDDEEREEESRRPRERKD